MAETISRQELEQRRDEVQLIDVRADHEWEAGRIAGAEHIVLNELPAAVERLDQDRPVVLYCRGGNRSTAAAEALGQAGFDARKLEGGITDWADAGLPLEPESGYVAESGEAAAVLQERRREATG